MIFGAIVTYNPDIGVLKKNIHSIIGQVDKLIVVDNCSENRIDIQRVIEEKEIVWIPLNKNMGLAFALNKAFRCAISMDAKWVVILDQDSIVPDDYIACGQKLFCLKKVGIITSKYIDRNLGNNGRSNNESEKYSVVERCITSGAIVRVDAFLAADGFDDELYVDYVDFDFSLRLRRKGYIIVLMNDVYMEHELGESRKVRFLFWKVRYTSHSKIRERLIARSIVIFLKKHQGEKTTRDKLSLIKHFVFSALYDDNKMGKILSLINGIRDGRKYNKIHKGIKSGACYSKEPRQNEKEDILLSVIMPVYNAEAFLRSTLSDLCEKCMDKKVEIVVVNDGSTDKSMDIIMDLSEKYTFKYIDICNRGPSGARNEGIRHSHGKYVTFVDCDDYVGVNTYERLMRVASRTNADVVCYPMALVDCKGNSDRTEFIDHGLCTNFIKYPVYMNSPCNKLFRRRLIQQLKVRFPEDIESSEDFLFCFEVMTQAGSVVYSDAGLYKYMRGEVNPNSITSRKNTTADAVVKEISDIKAMYKHLYGFCRRNGCVIRYGRLLLKRRMTSLLRVVFKTVKLYRLKANDR